MEGGKTVARPASQPGRRRRRRQRVGMRESVISPVVSECVAGRKKSLTNRDFYLLRRSPNDDDVPLRLLRSTCCRCDTLRAARYATARSGGWSQPANVDGTWTWMSTGGAGCQWRQGFGPWTDPGGRGGGRRRCLLSVTLPVVLRVEGRDGRTRRRRGKGILSPSGAAGMTGAAVGRSVVVLVVGVQGVWCLVVGRDAWTTGGDPECAESVVGGATQLASGNVPALQLLLLLLLLLLLIPPPPPRRRHVRDGTASWTESQLCRETYCTTECCCTVCMYVCMYVCKAHAPTKRPTASVLVRRPWLRTPDGSNEVVVVATSNNRARSIQKDERQGSHAGR